MFIEQGISSKYSSVLANIDGIENYDSKQICVFMNIIKVDEEKLPLFNGTKKELLSYLETKKMFETCKIHCLNQ